MFRLPRFLFGLITCLTIFSPFIAQGITQQELNEVLKKEQGNKLSSRCDLSCETDPDRILTDFWEWCTGGDRAILGDAEVYAQKRADACKKQPAKKSEPKKQPAQKQNKQSNNDGIIVKGLYEQPSNVCKKVCGEASKCELHSFSGNSNTIYCPGKGNAWVDNNGNDYETGKPVKFGSTKPKSEPAPKKAETPAKKAEPSEQDKCKDSGGLWEDKKCKHEGDPCTKVYGSGVGTYVKVGNDWKCKLTECKGAGYDIDASDNGYSCTIVGSKKEKKPENPKSEPAGEEAQNSSENNAQIEQIKSEAQQILDAYNKRKEELKSK